MNRKPAYYRAHTLFPTIIGIITISMTLLSCAGVPVLTPNEVLSSEPAEESILIVGCVIIDSVDRSMPPFLESPLFVTVAHESSGRDQPNAELFRVRTDSLGFFALTAKSVGYYWLFLVGSSTGASPWVLRRGFGKTGEYWVHDHDISAISLPDRPPRYAKEAKPGDTIDLGYQLLAYDNHLESRTRGSVLHRELVVLDGVSFYSGVTYNRPSVAEFLIHQYPHSRWIQRLRSLVPK